MTSLTEMEAVFAGIERRLRDGRNQGFSGFFLLSDYMHWFMLFTGCVDSSRLFMKKSEVVTC